MGRPASFARSSPAALFIKKSERESRIALVLHALMIAHLPQQSRNHLNVPSRCAPLSNPFRPGCTLPPRGGCSKANAKVHKVGNLPAIQFRCSSGGCDCLGLCSRAVSVQKREPAWQRKPSVADRGIPLHLRQDVKRTLTPKEIWGARRLPKYGRVKQLS
jgi:hypothetical protein